MVKMITNPLQAFTAGGTWGNPSGDNQMTVEVANVLNNTGLALYVGDIVCLDVTGTQAILSTAAGDPTAVGCVGGDLSGSQYPATYPTSGAIGVNAQGGGFLPPQDSPVFTDTIGTTNTSTTVTDTNAKAQYLGLQVLAAGVPLGAVITAVTPGTGFVISIAATATASVTAQIMMPPGTNGPGWGPTSVYPIGVEVPIVMRGYGRVNISGATTLIAKGAISVASASVAGTYVVSPTVPGAQIATALQAYAARDTSLTTAGITGHDSVLALIGKF